MRVIRTEFESAAKSAADFQKQIALTVTIADGAKFNEISEAVRNLSDQFNLPLLQTAQGVYQALSNQVGDFGESLKFTEEAARFAKATNSSFADSVDLLSAALNGYGLTVDDTDKISSIFFTASDQGRLTASELANSFGRIDTLAADLGVSLEETAGALASISVRGTKSAESITQLRGILSALEKPTDEMKRALEGLGFSSAQTAIQTLTLPGVLDKLAASTGGSQEQLARLFPNIRGLAGASSLLSDDLTSLADNIREMTTASRDFNREKFLQATATDAETVTKEINKLSNAFTVELGQSVLHAAADLTKFVGGADTVVDAVKTAGPALIGLGASMLAFRASTAAANAEMGLLSKSLGLLAAVPLAIGAGRSIGLAIDDKLSSRLNAVLKAQEDADKQALDNFTKNQATVRDSAKATDHERIQSARAAAQELGKSYIEQKNAAISADKAMADSADAALKRIVGAREKLVEELGKAAGEADNIIRQSQQRIVDLANDQTDRNFSSRVGQFSDPQQVVLLAQKAEQLAREAAEQLSHALNPEQVQQALQAFERARGFGEDAASIANRVGNRGLEARAAQTLNDITSRQIQAERQLEAIQISRKAALEKERDEQQRIVNAIREQAKILSDNTGVFDKSGNQFSEAEQARRAAARQSAAQNIANLALNQRDLTAAGALGIAGFISQFQEQLQRDPLKLQFDVERSTAEVRQRMQAAFEQFRIGLPFDLSALEQFAGKALETPDQIDKALGDAQKKADDLRVAIDKAVANDEAVAKLRGKLDTVFAEFDRLGAKRPTIGLFVPGTAEVKQQFTSLRQDMATVLQDGKVTEDELVRLSDAFRELGESVVNGGAGIRTQFSTSLDAATKAIARIQEIQEQQKGGDTAELRQELQSIEQLIGSINPAPAFRDAAAAIGQGVSPAQQIAAAWSNSARDAERTAAAAASGGAKKVALGGYIQNFAAGGFAPSGTDTIPAMLSPREAVINSRQAERFHPQIVAMNAGVRPSFPTTNNNGGNVSIGDININEAGDAQSTAREVVTLIRREFRRGASRL